MTHKFAFEIDDPVLAYAAWSRIAEPGDQPAAILIDSLGASDALRWVGQGSTRSPIPSHPASSAWVKSVRRWHPRLENLDPRRECEVISRLGGGVIIPGDPLWPSQLNDLGAAVPMCLWYRGDPSHIATLSHSVALVGSRAATPYGQSVTHNLASSCADQNIPVVSGGAFGIDIAAHASALAADGCTVAVMAGGLDRLYPKGNETTLQRVIDQYVVVSEAPPGTSPMRQRFLQRNRLIAGLATGTIVVEAAWRSGALSTAYHAAELMRPLGAVPGPITSVASAGCHRLIREGAAVCVTGIEDIEELIGVFDAQRFDSAEPIAEQLGLLDGLDPLVARVLDSFPVRRGTDVDSLVQVSGCSPQEVLGALGKLLRLGKAERFQDQWRRVKETSSPSAR